MSELEYTIAPTSGNAVATTTLRLTSADIAVLKQAGNPTVEFGGQVETTIGGTPVSQTLGTNVQALVDGLRVSVQFKQQPAVAENVALAQAWVTQVTGLVQTALTTKRTQATAITGNLAGIATV